MKSIVKEIYEEKMKKLSKSWMTKEEILLSNIEKERGKYPANDELIKKLVDKLIEKGIYPSETKTGMSVFTMVKSWGAYWYIYNEPLECFYCKANLRDEKNGPPFKREIGMSDSFLDRIVDFVCPDCYRSLDDGKHYDKTEFQKVNNVPLIEN